MINKKASVALEVEASEPEGCDTLFNNDHVAMLLIDPGNIGSFRTDTQIKGIHALFFVANML
ncbi:hypothetical protein [uncultured Methanolobus sp.]|uniref:hypothetical protein n=1 Tax=uncultured Methanolobus sp. TaxID=218300 RepID=UPI002AAAD3C5|nr:hypothetical protein [uncultured Methanolobus sp.]